ncbi:GDP-mannose 4,6-dehydratase [Neobacillus sp. SuZ13]|uniref:GDP-mannose 4,6-dehydratase n=1 Tax=Neobacillus sp. SuZ13 TaxID=3047875 RepID=UPI0024C00D7B|nr:GDP-mannose 4,6-dehydratase [Neobacillus sp. SuZ13]WHY69737.1 GDP-mannose 4,6-dehydratase [Neobacillus sp. SuZ13]
MKKKVLITGVAGFLGSHLAKDLLDDGTILVGIDNLSSGKMTNITNLPEDRLLL